VLLLQVGQRRCALAAQALQPSPQPLSTSWKTGSWTAAAAAAVMAPFGSVVWLR
jgi:hypothetical protein